MSSVVTKLVKESADFLESYYETYDGSDINAMNRCGVEVGIEVFRRGDFKAFVETLDNPYDPEMFDSLTAEFLATSFQLCPSQFFDANPAHLEKMTESIIAVMTHVGLKPWATSDIDEHIHGLEVQRITTISSWDAMSALYLDVLRQAIVM